MLSPSLYSSLASRRRYAIKRSESPPQAIVEGVRIEIQGLCHELAVSALFSACDGLLLCNNSTIAWYSRVLIS